MIKIKTENFALLPCLRYLCGEKTTGMAKLTIHAIALKKARYPRIAKISSWI
jgi:hypothetical protein